MRIRKEDGDVLWSPYNDTAVAFRPARIIDVARLAATVVDVH